ncbi:MAG: hypothetical protein KGL39_53015 [Patescibacteria group bacterium]|nr:hypothetical protein [Patescibacteria group bacterium]
MNQYPKFRLIDSQDEALKVVEAIKADNDSLILPSHLVERRCEIVGAASLGVMPLVCVWNHSKHITARDSMHLKLVYDSIMETKGHQTYLIACNKQSPYNSHMERLGFKPVWSTDLFIGGTKA